MRYCLNCRRITIGEPLYCNFCGRSYDAKICPSRHINPRSADICSQCGSRDLSTPAPRTPIWLLPALWLVIMIPGVLLLLLSVALFVRFIQAFPLPPELLLRYLFVGLLLGLLWYLYMQLPISVRRLFHIELSKSAKRKHGS